MQNQTIDDISEEGETASVATETAPEEKNSYGIKKDACYRPVNKRKMRIHDGIYLVLASLIYTVAFHYFVATAKFAPGGIGGIVAMVKHITGIGSSVSTGGIDYSPFLILILNSLLLIPAKKTLSTEFVVKTAITSVLMTAFLFILDNVIDPNYVFSITQSSDDTDVGTRFLSALLAGACYGVSIAFSLKINSSTGGADILGAMLQKKYPHKSFGSMLFMVNCIILAVSIFVYRENLMPVLLSCVYMFVSSEFGDKLLDGSKKTLKFEVISEHSEQIAAEIIETLGHGVTVVPAQGMFEHKKKGLLICIISPRQVSKFQNIINKYPETFAYVGSVNEIYGKFNKGEDIYK